LTAAGNGHEAVVKLLVEKGADLESKDRFGRIPLSLAAMNGHEAVVKLLVEKGADLEYKDHNGQTSLSFATKYGHKAVVKLLLEKGAKEFFALPEAMILLLDNFIDLFITLLDLEVVLLLLAY
jgi:ankyrin repeat protein